MTTKSARTALGGTLSAAPPEQAKASPVSGVAVARNAEQSLKQAVLYAPVFPVRWRWDAGRALAVPRFYGARKVPPPIQRMRADDLLAAVFPAQVGCQENLAGPLELDKAAFQRDLAAPVTSTRHEALLTEAAERGAFGVPTFFLGQQMFWGNDRLVLLEAALGSRA